MEVFLVKNTFNSYGGSTHLRPLEALLELKSPSFGTAVSQLIFELNFANELPFEKQGVNKSLEQRYHDHNSGLKKLPKRTFRRKKKELEIRCVAAFASAELFDGIHGDITIPKTPEDVLDSIVKPRKTKQPHDRELHRWNVAACKLLVSEIEACRGKFKASEDFNYAGWVEWLQRVPELLPKTSQSTSELLEEHKTYREKNWNSKSDWEKLSLDWGVFHKGAREIIADPRLWSQTHDFSPNGNDTGADILAAVVEQRTNLSNSDGTHMYKSIWNEWGFDASPPQMPDDSIEYEEHRKIILGLTFAFLKVLGKCPDWMISSSIIEIDNYRVFVNDHHKDWPHFAECLEYLDAMQSVLVPIRDTNSK